MTAEPSPNFFRFEIVQEIELPPAAKGVAPPAWGTAGTGSVESPLETLFISVYCNGTAKHFLLTGLLRICTISNLNCSRVPSRASMKPLELSVDFILFPRLVHRKQNRQKKQDETDEFSVH